MTYIAAILLVLLLVSMATTMHMVIKNKQLEVDKNDLSQSLEEKQHLLSVLFHDLSNSTTLLSLLSDSTILAMKDKEGILKNLGRVSGVIENMSELIQHIRKIQSIESGKSTIKLEPVKLEDTIKSSIQLVRKRLDKKGQHIRLEILNKNLKAMAEPSSLNQSVFTNLITNASKFSPQGSEILIKVSNRNSAIQVDIIDQGIGIPESMLSGLFSFTNETHREGTHGEEGSGFGLPVVKKYMNFYGGDIKAFNNRDEIGSTFRLKFVNAAYVDTSIDTQIVAKRSLSNRDKDVLEIHH
ncbi:MULTISPECIES: sensor histidine kinase [Halobacteriovorax]|uniref:histidine kinase n=1 Tax=Halobacteriovorax vibrionivorans TaxID=2152716 RepID=A0ABY0IEI5_9BACT|nr:MULTISPECIES: HAMP domain-containing sensor histidine kinase [Halobacteriovorax]AYF44120.1 GHKL domain protein [Halobacteriovorax sp. BALOs_7]RZF21355.1 HAMP domain-containing histidine kinase [Halobacteriovorax vibrionivorans]TGD47887.1 HAMP domain-containing histidine kinase [Halobacteriovorax sp. Y22]